MNVADPLREESPRGFRGLQKRDLIILLLIWAAGSLLMLIFNQARYFSSRGLIVRYRVGDTVQEDYILDRDLSYIDQEATEKLIALNRSLVPPIYSISPTITASVMEKFDRFAALLPSAMNDGAGSMAGDTLLAQFPGMSGLLGRGAGPDKARLSEVLSVTRDVLQTIQYGGIFRLDHQVDQYVSGVIEVIYSRDVSNRRTSLAQSSLVVPGRVEERASQLLSEHNLLLDEKEFAQALIIYFSEVNGYFERELSVFSQDRAEEETTPVSINLEGGTLLLPAGSVVTEPQAQAIEAIRSARGLSIRSFTDPFLYVAVILAFGFIAGRTFGIRVRHRRKTLILYAVLWIVYIVIATVLTHFIPFPDPMTMVAVLPSSLFTLLLAQLLQDRKLAIVSALLMALLTLFVTDLNAAVFLVTLGGGIGGALSVGRRETRIGLLRAGPRLAFLLALFVFVAGLLQGYPSRELLLASGLAAINGLVTGILGLAFLPLLEHLLNTATTFRLIELSDQNVPVLRRMRLQAPGTYIHSQNVAHLSEAACDAIGADGLLARVGAYYHDIGKVDQAHFFVENQTGENRHDDLKATLSAAVIKSHVKIGMEKGRELRLPDEVLAFIEQHHGTSVIRYFYDRAVKEKGLDAISQEDFSYGGPKPRSKETAVVMLADAAEAATRTLKKPTSAKLEKYVWDLVMDRFRIGELSECDLSLRDLETIKNIFVHVLTGHFHSRIAYPKAEGEQDE